MTLDSPSRRSNLLKFLISALSFVSQLSLCVSSPVSAHPLHGNKYYDGKALSVPISTESGIDMYQHWMEQAYSGLFSAFAKQKAATMPKYARKELADCFSKATTVILHANCLLTLLPEKSGGNFCIN
ncbi:MLt-TeN (mlt-10) related [Ditylenchus destructor]|nr:MLt-TeN (mlt-10) related [Ditylenchus destructor]